MIKNSLLAIASILLSAVDVLYDYIAALRYGWVALIIGIIAILAFTYSFIEHQNAEEQKRNTYPTHRLNKKRS